MPYKVHYFNSRGKAEVIRFLLVAAEQKFEDIRVEKEKWPELKPKTPTGVLPYVETPENQVLVQSGAIARLLAKKYNFYGKTENEFYLVERALAQIEDISSELIKIFHAPEATREASFKEFGEGKGKLLVKTLVKFIEEGKTGFFAGSAPTVADLTLLHNLDYLRIACPNLVKENPELDKHSQRTVDAMPLIKKWIADRPVTQF